MSKTFTLVQRHRSRGIKTWYIRTCSNGKESFKSTGTANKTEAMKAFTKFVNLANANISTTIADIFIEDECEEWLKMKSTSLNSHKSLKAYKINLRTFRTYCKRIGIQTIADLTPTYAQRYIDELKDKGLSPQSINGKYVVAKSTIEFAINRHEVLARNPFSLVVKPKKKPRIVEFWTVEECEKILDQAPNMYYKAFWGLMCYAGLRFFEARKVRAEDINDGVLTIKHGKMDKDGVIPVSARLMSLLEPVLEAQNGIEGSLFRYRITHVMKCTKVLREAINRAGLKLEENETRLNHKFRHSFASELLRKGINPSAVQKLGRWTNPRTMFENYSGVMQKDLVDAVNIL